jgi:predicted enzyme related to lactoylglutathione lyase
MNLLVNIDVEELSKAITFYAQAFDLRIGRRLGEGAVEMLGASVPIYLLAKSSGSKASDVSESKRDYRRHWTPIHLDIVVDDIEGAVNKALNAGATQERPVQLNIWGKLALMSDPFGNGFCLVQFVGRGYDEIAAK